MTDCDRILKWWKTHQFITVLDGYKMNPPCTCIGQRITDLRKRGVMIDDVFVTNENGKRFKLYWLAKGKK